MAESASRTALGPGTRIGPYVAAQIGEGGMGEVYRATDTNLKRAVAIKVLPAALNHPHIAQIHGPERTGELTVLMLKSVESEATSVPPQLNVILNWTQELTRLVPAN